MHLQQLSIAQEFFPGGRVLEIREFGNGNINDTYLVTTDSAEEQNFIVQRINTHVFKQPRLIMQNMRAFTEHIRRRAREEGHRWEMPRVLSSRDGQDYHFDVNGDFWRAISYVKNAKSYDTIRNLDHAGEVGYALGVFQNLISDLPIEKLSDTLEGFHITPRYLQQYDHALSQNGFKSNPELRHCLNFVEERRTLAYVLEDAREQGKLQVRAMHGDPKVNNVMIEESTGRAISLVDLDTVKPGLIHYDIGDCMRSGCNPLGEETENWEAVRFDPETGSAILEGYLAQARAFLTTSDYEYLFDSIRLLAFELGIRFLADHLAGNTYFKVKHPRHNLQRALVQFKLTESIEDHEADIRNIIAKMVEVAQ
jgi:Ser/Thr protein kinase RdoA (MazF antagonist)